MIDLPKDRILNRITLENRWWEAPHQLPPVFAELRPRPYLELFHPLVAERRVRRGILLLGPRRVGKTFLLHHSIGRLLKSGVPPKNIVYISVDVPAYAGLSLERLLELYAEASGVSLVEEETFVFLDEIQYLDSWEQHLKSLVDVFPLAKVVASGSAAAALRLKSRESGAGRWTDFLLPPLTFSEYLELIGEAGQVEIERQGEGAVFFADNLPAMNDHFVTYVSFGGYPEVAISPAIRANPERFIRTDILDRVLLRDLPSLYGISDNRELNAFFNSLAFNTGQELSLEELAKRSGVAKNTLKRYLTYLEAAFLIRLVHRIDENARRFRRARHFKVYLTNPSLRTALFGTTEANDPTFGSLVETAIFDQWFHAQGKLLHYARWKSGELDIVSLKGNQRPEWAVEVKWSDRHVGKPEALREALGFCVNNNLRQLTVTTKSKSGRAMLSNVEVSLWPAALYTYAIGYGLLHPEIKTLEVGLTT